VDYSHPFPSSSPRRQSENFFSFKICSSPHIGSTQLPPMVPATPLPLSVESVLWLGFILSVCALPFAHCFSFPFPDRFLLPFCQILWLKSRNVEIGQAPPNFSPLPALALSLIFLLSSRLRFPFFFLRLLLDLLCVSHLVSDRFFPFVFLAHRLLFNLPFPDF